MSDKYVVKNCPARLNGFCVDDYPELFCIDKTDCLIKQVIKKCKGADRILYEGDFIKIVDTNKVGREILQLFEIEEVE